MNWQRMNWQRLAAMFSLFFFIGLAGKMEMSPWRLIAFVAGYSCLRWFEWTVTHKAEEENDELNRLFEIQSARMKQASALWREAHPGNEGVLPDLGALLTWLLEGKENHE